MLPSVRQFLQLIDAESIVEAHGFAVKVNTLPTRHVHIVDHDTDQPGAAVKLNQHKREGCKTPNGQDLVPILNILQIRISQRTITALGTSYARP
jgi:hypothetical protein